MNCNLGEFSLLLRWNSKEFAWSFGIIPALDFLAVQICIAGRILVQRIRAVSINLFTIEESIRIRVGVCGIRTYLGFFRVRKSVAIRVNRRGRRYGRYCFTCCGKLTGRRRKSRGKGGERNANGGPYGRRAGNGQKFENSESGCRE